MLFYCSSYTLSLYTFISPYLLLLVYPLGYSSCKFYIDHLLNILLVQELRINLSKQIKYLNITSAHAFGLDCMYDQIARY